MAHPHLGVQTTWAKGRVERLWGTLQHRLVVELRLAGVSNADQANAFLPGFIDSFNQRFAVKPIETQSAFRPAPPPGELNRILSLKIDRKASNGSLISYSGQTYQLVDEHGTIALLRPRSTVNILCHLDGSISALYNNKPYRLKPFITPAPVAKQPSKNHDTPRPQPKPAKDHPWRKPSIKPRRNYYPYPRDFNERDQRWSRLYLET